MQHPVLSATFKEALEYAATVHNDQVRKGTTVPYLSHLLAVCALELIFILTIFGQQKNMYTNLLPEPIGSE